METLFRKVLVSERLPDKEGRYIVSNGLGWFEVSYSKDFSFHEEFTDCSGVEAWLEPVELPSEDMLPIDVLLHNNTMYHDDALQKACNNGIKMCYNYILGFINNKK